MRSLFVDGLHFAFMFILFALMLAGFMGVPYGTALPVHWNIQGQVDATMPREIGLLIAPVVGLVMIGALWLFRRLVGAAEVEAGRAIWGMAITGITGMLCVVQAVIVLAGMGVEVPMVRILVLVLAVLMILMGYVLPNSRPNRFAGIRLPWTLADEENWKETHRFTGAAFIVAGVVLGVSGLLLSQPVWLGAILVVVVLAPTAAGTAYSYWLARRKARDTRV